MSELAPLETLYEAAGGAQLPLPPELASLYGQLRDRPHPGPPHVAGNFVTTLDGVVSLNVPGQSGGGEISGFNQHDRMVMGLLRALADAVIVGAGTLRAVPRHLWTADYIYPPLADQYQQLRETLGKPDPPLNVIVTARGEIDLDLPVFRSGRVPALIATTVPGARRIAELDLPPGVRVVSVGSADSLSPRAILDAVCSARQCDRILVEGGPHLLGDFFAESCLDELFLTLAPQVAGRDGLDHRLGLIEGKVFAPTRSLWGTLVGVKRGESHLFLRYAFARREGAEGRES